MTQINDPLRFLNLKKKRQSNKQQRAAKNSNTQQFNGDQTSRFILPSFNSQNSLEYEENNRIRKIYNPHKYFNPEIEQYLNKIKAIKIANSPVMPQSIFKQTSSKVKTGAQGNQEPLFKTYKAQQKQLMTFAKDQQLELGLKLNNGLKSTFNFNKLGLKKSASMIMMEKMQEVASSSAINQSNKEQEISPWQLPELQQQQQQLKQCEICGRKFNPKSYSKHVKVCNKVFFQKRKPFDSRSHSKDKKPNS